MNFVSSVGFQSFTIWMFFWKKFCGAILEIIFRQTVPQSALFFDSIWSGRIKRVETLDEKGFGVKAFKNATKFLLTIFFVFLRCHYRFMNCFEILHFVFSNIILRRFSTWKILTFQNQYFQKYIAKNIVKFSFLAFLAFLF